jgi:hypothetical protein
MLFARRPHIRGNIEPEPPQRIEQERAASEVDRLPFVPSSLVEAHSQSLYVY